MTVRAIVISAVVVVATMTNGKLSPLTICCYYYIAICLE
jgi:hypothetical protein